MVRNYVRRDVDILRYPPSLTNILPELVSKLVLSIPALSAPTLHYQERTTSGRVTEPVVRDTQGCRNVLFT